MEYIFDMHDVEDDDCDRVLSLLFDSDDEEEETRVDSSVVGRAPNIEGNFDEEALRLYDESSSNILIYPKHMFSRQLRMSERFFTNICEQLAAKCE